MNTYVSKAPRPMCRLVQGWVSVFGDGAAPPRRGFGARHVATCDCCRQFFADSAMLESSLRREASRENASPSSDLERRIVEAVHRSARPLPARRSAPLGALLFVGAAACAAVAVILSLKSPAPANGPAIAATGTASAGILAETLTVGSLWTDLPPAADAILGGEPLQQEANAVYSDARSAIRFLAMNFLPSVPASLASGAKEAPPRARSTNG